VVPVMTVTNKVKKNREMPHYAGWNSTLFAVRLREIIGEGAVSQFARKCDLAESMLRKYLQGDSVPGTDKLVRMAEVAGVSLSWLATGKGTQSDAVGWDRLTPIQLAIVLEFERFARQRGDAGARSAINAFVRDYNAGALEIGTLGEITQLGEEELILWRDLAWERRVERAAIDEAGLRTAIEIADELLATSGKTMEAEKKARLIIAIYRLNATTEEGLDRAMLMNLLTAIA